MSNHWRQLTCCSPRALGLRQLQAPRASLDLRSACGKGPREGVPPGEGDPAISTASTGHCGPFHVAARGGQSRPGLSDHVYHGRRCQTSAWLGFPRAPQALCLVSRTLLECVDVSSAHPRIHGGREGGRGARPSGPGLLGSVTQPTAAALPQGPQTRGTCGQAQGWREEGLGRLEALPSWVTTPHPPSPTGPPSGPTASASWKSGPCPTGQPSPSGTRAGRAAGSTAA